MIVASCAVCLTKPNLPSLPTTSELLCIRVAANEKACVVAAIYRPGFEKVSAPFIDEFGSLLEFLSSFSMLFVDTGDLNIRFDRPDDLMVHRANELILVYGAKQMVGELTHNRGGILDVVIAREEGVPTNPGSLIVMLKQFM